MFDEITNTYKVISVFLLVDKWVDIVKKLQKMR